MPSLFQRNELVGVLQRFSVGLGLLLCLMGVAATKVTIRDESGRPGTSVSLPVVIESDNPLYGIQLDVRFDANQLIASLATPVLDLGSDVVIKTSFIASGHQRLAIYSLGSQPLPNQSVAQLHFSIPSDIPVEPTLVRVDGLRVAGGDGSVLEGEGQSGTLSIVVVPDVVVISGAIRYYSNETPMPEVTLQVRGAEAVNGASDVDGRFSISVPSESPLEMTAEKNSEPMPNRGVTSLDLLLTRRHILGVAPFSSPFQLLAADVDRDGDVGALDLLLMRRLILGLAPDFVSEQPLFRFVSSEAVFQDPLMPWDIPGSFAYSTLSADLAGQDFRGVKLGDVDGDWIPDGGTQSPGNRIPMRVQPRSLVDRWSSVPVQLSLRHLSEDSQSGIRSMVVEAGQIETVDALQFSLGWDAEQIELIEVHPAGLPGLNEEHFGRHPVLESEGRLSFAWSVPPTEGGLHQENLPLFRVDYFRKPGSEALVSLKSDPTPAIGFRSGRRVEVVASLSGEEVEKQRTLPVEILRLGRDFVIRSLVESSPGSTYVFEYAEQWPARDWMPLAFQPGDGESLSFQDRILPGKARFYRLRVGGHSSNFERMLGSSHDIWEEVE